MIRRGGIYWVNFGDPQGSAPALRRPAVVVQSNSLNASAWRTTVVVPLTSNVARAVVPGHVMIPAHSSGLPKDSVAVASQVVAVDKSEVEPFAETDLLPKYLMDDLAQALRLVLEL